MSQPSAQHHEASASSSAAPTIVDHSEYTRKDEETGEKLATVISLATSNAFDRRNSATGELVDEKERRSSSSSEQSDDHGCVPPRTSATTTPELSALERQATTAAAASTSLVDWDGPDDPENPLNWSIGYKSWLIVVLALMNFVISFGSSIFSTATVVTAERFGVSQEVMILGVSLYVVGFALGPLVWAPVSELYGRYWSLMAGMLGFLIFQIPLGVAENLETVFVCRFLAGAMGSSALAIVPGLAVDIFEPMGRGVATLAYSAAVFAGPTLGPVVGEFTVKNPSLGWHWTAWITMIMGSLFFLLTLFTTRETFPPVLLQKKAARLRYETKDWSLHTKADEEPAHAAYLFRKYGLKPIEMIVMEPILVVMTLYISLVYGILYLIFFAYPYSFELDRHLQFGVASLPFIALFVGVLLACVALIFEAKFIFLPKLMKAQKAIPEERLPPMIAGGISLAIGLFWFAWTSKPSITIWPQIISGAFIGGGTMAVFIPALVYLVDVYTVDANSALAANTFVRSLVAAAFPLFAPYMYRDMGVEWATSLLAFLTLTLVPATWGLYKFGARIRGWSRFAGGRT